MTVISEWNDAKGNIETTTIEATITHLKLQVALGEKKKDQQETCITTSSFQIYLYY